MKSILILAAITAIFFSCNENSDTVKPVINLIEPAEGDALQIGSARGVHFEAEFSDNENLASYKVNIHQNLDGHTHTRATSDFEFEKSWTISGRNVAIHHHEIIIPENATPGNYHLMVYCTDAAGNEAHIALNVVLSHEAGEDED
jgi:hypothetical protein